VKEPDLRELDGEVGEQDEQGALPLFPRGGDFVLRVASAMYQDNTARMSHLLNLVLFEHG
jgi:hypothetical protein